MNIDQVQKKIGAHFQFWTISFSGGVFSLLSAHLANLLLHHETVSRPYLKLVGLLAISSLEVGFGVYRRYAPATRDYLKVGFVAQLAGIVSGITIGLVSLKVYLTGHNGKVA